MSDSDLPPDVAIQVVTAEVLRLLAPLAGASREHLPASPDDERRRAIREHWVGHHQQEYERTGNPVHAWHAIGECLSGSLPLPAWAAAYLLTSASRIAALARSDVPRRDAIGGAVAKALGLQGRAKYNPFVELWRPGHDHMIAMRVYQHQTAHRDAKWSGIFHDVATEHSRQRTRCQVCPRGRISAKSVERIWRARALSVIPPHLIAQAKSQKLDDILR